MTIQLEVKPPKMLNINNALTKQQKSFHIVLQAHAATFAWDYSDMKGIDPKLCIHKIYINEGCRTIRLPQRHMNLALREIVKDELKNLLNARFVYPILNSEWVSPLFIVPNKGGKWQICVNYRELNIATRKDHFPLPFIDQVLDSLVGKK
jgi:hypothetical protein